MTPGILFRLLASPTCATLTYMLWASHPVLAGLALGCAFDAAVGAAILYFHVKHPTCGECAGMDQL